MGLGQIREGFVSLMGKASIGLAAAVRQRRSISKELFGGWLDLSLVGQARGFQDHNAVPVKLNYALCGQTAQ